MPREIFLPLATAATEAFLERAAGEMVMCLVAVAPTAGAHGPTGEMQLASHLGLRGLVPGPRARPKLSTLLCSRPLGSTKMMAIRTERERGREGEEGAKVSAATGNPEREKGGGESVWW